MKQWQIRTTDEFEEWFTSLNADEQVSLDASILVLGAEGPTLGRPYVDTVNGSRHSNIKELRTQHHGRPLRTFFAFDPQRQAVLLIGGDKTGEKRFYDRMIPKADDVYGKHLDELKKGDD